MQRYIGGLLKVYHLVQELKKLPGYIYVLTSNLISVYQSIVEPYFDNCSIVRNDISDRHTDKLQSLQNSAAHVTQVPLYYQLPVSYQGDIEQT